MICVSNDWLIDWLIDWFSGCFIVFVWPQRTPWPVCRITSSNPALPGPVPHPFSRSLKSNTLSDCPAPPRPALPSPATLWSRTISTISSSISFRKRFPSAWRRSATPTASAHRKSSTCSSTCGSTTKIGAISTRIRFTAPRWLTPLAKPSPSRWARWASRTTPRRSLPSWPSCPRRVWRTFFGPWTMKSTFRPITMWWRWRVWAPFGNSSVRECCPWSGASKSTRTTPTRCCTGMYAWPPLDISWIICRYFSTIFQISKSFFVHLVRFNQINQGLKDGLIDWSIDGLICILIDWLIGWLIGGLMDWLIDWLMDWLIDWLVDWWIDWLIDWVLIVDVFLLGMDVGLTVFFPELHRLPIGFKLFYEIYEVCCEKSLDLNLKMIHWSLVLKVRFFF